MLQPDSFYVGSTKLLVRMPPFLYSWSLFLRLREEAGGRTERL